MSIFFRAQRARISRSLVTVLALSTVGLLSIELPLAGKAEAATVTTGNCSINTSGAGGVEVLDSTTADGTCLVRFTSGTNGFTLPSEVQSIRTLVVGGGGGGGFGGNAGGGGAGTVLYSSSGINVSAGATISATIGTGGAAGINDADSTNQTYWGPGTNGGDTTLSIAGNSFVASGGGSGGGQGSINARYNGASGGSGGGGTISGSGTGGSASNISYSGWTAALNAGSGYASNGGGGGGGAGAAFGSSTSNGAIGVTIFGYAIGGGGGGWSGGSSTLYGNAYGGGLPRTGGTYVCTGGSCNGSANTGGGGGGGGAGGSGVAVVKYIPVRNSGTIATTGVAIVGRTRTFTFTRSYAASTGVTATYQWQVKAAGSSTWSNVSTGTGGTTTTYTTAGLLPADSGNSYRIVATDTNASLAISTVSTVEVASATIPGLDTDYALNLDGSTQYAQAADTTAFDVTNAFTFEAWVKPTDVTGYRMIMNKENSFEVYITNGVFTVSVDGSATTWTIALNNVPAIAGEWHHIAVVRAASSANYTFYLDGVVAYTGAYDTLGTATPINTVDPFTIGSRSSVTSQNFAGSIDNVAGFSTARTAAQVLADMNGFIDGGTTGLLYYYDFNEGAGTTVYNHAVTGTSATDLTIYGSATYSDVKTIDTSTAYTQVKFPRTYITPIGGWKSPAQKITYNALLVAGGGGGGARVSSGAGGGGGAGGMIDTSYKTLDTSTVVSIKVGQGGSGSITGTMTTIAPGDNGANTVVVAGATTLTAIGGGGGAGGTTSDLTSYLGKSGGSGGGASGSSTSGYAGGSALQTSGSGYTGYGNAGGANPGCPSYRQAGGGGGAGGSGQTPAVCTPAASGNGGAGRASAITGLTYAGGGGGGTSGDGGVSAGVGGSGGGATGGTWKTITASVGTINLGNYATANTGGGGGGTGIATGITMGGGGAAGIVVIKYLSVALPTYSDPVSDTTTAGLTYTFTVTGSAPSPWVRTYKWQSSTDTGTSWSDISSGSGFATASYTTPVLETSTSGPQYLYRVMVIDTNGGTIVTDISTAAYLVINARLILNGSFTAMKYGTTHSDTFTVPADSGTGNKSVRLTSSVKQYITWDTSTANTAVVTVGVLLPAGTYIDTITVTDSRSVTSHFPISIIVLKADTITVTVANRIDTYTASALTYLDTFTVTGLVAGDTISAVSYNYSGTANDGTVITNSTRPLLAGSYSINPVFTIARASNYESVTVTTGQLSINRKVRTVSATSKPTALKYGDTSTVVGLASDGVGDGLLSYASSTSSLCTFSGAIITAVEASGTCQFTTIVGRGNNFETATSTTYSVSLSQADTITVTVDSITATTYTGSTAIVNPTIRVTGLVYTDTTTSTSATFTYRPASGAGLFSQIKPTNSDTYTVRADTFTVTSGLLSRYKAVRYVDGIFRINRAQQAQLIFSQYQSVFGAPYRAIAYGGSGTGSLSYSIAAGTASGCSITGDTVTTTTEGSCLLTATRGQDQNYETNTASAYIYFLNWVNIYQPAPSVGSGSTIALSNTTTLIRDVAVAPTISSLSTYSGSAGLTQIIIYGAGFDHNNLSGITVKFWRNQVAAGFTVSSDDSQITVTVPAGATSGKVTVTTPLGLAVSEQIFTIVPFINM